ncbi:MAG: major capsid protein [Microvirus sp.]|nr:MAG: major capsid protein [Microvirus sp.]
MQMHRNKSVMKHTFSEVPKAEIPRSSFDRSFGHKTTFDSGYLIPIFCDEALPGDTFKVNMTGFARLATPIFPIMDNMYLDTQFFAVPIRLIWDNWQKFNGEQRNPSDSTDYLVPQMAPTTTSDITVGSLFDYMGVNPGIANLHVSALWARSYNLIVNEWYRDQNLQDSVINHVGDGPDPYTDYTLLRRGKRHDYFTSALPWPQKGPGVSIPLGGSAPIRGFGIDNNTLFPNTATVRETDGTTAVYSNSMFSNAANLWVKGTGPGGAGTNLDIYADLNEATNVTINSLRQAFQIQKIFERDARGGTRYTEIIRAHFGTISPDARLQRPELLSSSSTPVNISPIPQTSATGAYASSPQGNLAAMGTALASGHGFTMSFTEHCVILGLCSVRADLTYQQGLNRMFSRRTRFDFYWPALSHIGEQAIKNKEIYANGSSDDELTFGYQERYAEYRYKPSQITGLFRSTAAGTLDAWHLSQNFTARPTLSASFIEENPPVDRVIAVPSQPQFLFDSYFKMTCVRPMPVYGVPGLIDHF